VQLKSNTTDKKIFRLEEITARFKITMGAHRYVDVKSFLGDGLR